MPELPEVQGLVDFLGELDVEVVTQQHLGLAGGIWRVNYRTVAALDPYLMQFRLERREGA